MAEREEWTPEFLQLHRELQHLRAAGVSASTRRRRRRRHQVSQSSRGMRDWVGVRERKLDEANRLVEGGGAS